MWQVGPAGKGPATEEIWNKAETQKHKKKPCRWKEMESENQQDRENRRTCRAELYIQESNLFPAFVSFVLLPLDLFHLLLLFKTGMSFFCFMPSAPFSTPLREWSAIISLSYYRSDGGPFMQSVTFTESTDIRGGAAVMELWSNTASPKPRN